jgi:ribosomal protein L11 methyltransferase
MSWIEIKAVLESMPEDWSEWVYLFDRHGCENTLQTDEPPALIGCLVDVGGAAARLEALINELQAAGATKVETRPLPEENWEEHWKKFFKPRRIGQRLVVRPTWETYESGPNDVVLVLDPGQAFGTGDHPTTRLCLQLLEEMPLKGKNVADLGCGSGILSVAASLMGAERVAAIDIEPLSVEVAKENAKLNGVSFEAVEGHSLDAVQNPPAGWDVVVSNIISATLIRLAPEVSDGVAPSGAWTVSGIIKGNWPDVRRAAETVDFKLERMLEEDDWVAATFRR